MSQTIQSLPPMEPVAPETTRFSRQQAVAVAPVALELTRNQATRAIPRHGFDEVRQEDPFRRPFGRRETAVRSKFSMQWDGGLDAHLGRGLEDLGQRVDQIKGQWHATRERIEQMIRRSEVILAQCRELEDGSLATLKPCPQDHVEIAG